MIICIYIYIYTPRTDVPPIRINHQPHISIGTFIHVYVNIYIYTNGKINKGIRKY